MDTQEYELAKQVYFEIKNYAYSVKKLEEYGMSKEKAQLLIATFK